MNRIPEKLNALFWEYDPETLSLKQDRALIVGRILSSGSWDSVQWLRSQVGETEIRNWLLSSRGRNLSPPRLRFWELLLELPHAQVNAWLSETGRRIWDQRTVS